MIMQPTKCDSVTIVATDDDGKELRYRLAPNEGVFVGRSGNCGFKLPDAGIADIHCRIEFEAGKLWVQDWMSNGGTRVNGESIWTKVEIPDNAQISIGTHRLTFTKAAPKVNKNGVPSEHRSTDAGSLGDNAQDTDLLSADSSNADVPGADRLAAHGLGTTGSEVAETSDDLFDLEVDFFDDVDQETVDPELVEILQAEIEQLRAELAARDADQLSASEVVDRRPQDEPSDEVLVRMQELIDEADRSDERVAILEEMLHAAEVANRAEQEERQNLEGWVGDIETRIGQREDEHAAELELVRNRLEESLRQQQQLQRRLQQAASAGDGAEQFNESLEELQRDHQQVQEDLADARRENAVLRQRLEESGEAESHLLREERAKIAQEQAKISRLRFELTQKLASIEELPRTENASDQEAATRIRTLREHLREIHEQEKQEERDAPLTSKLARLWKRVEA